LLGKGGNDPERESSGQKTTGQNEEHDSSEVEMTEIMGNGETKLGTPSEPRVEPVDTIIELLLGFQNRKNTKDEVLEESQVRYLCTTAKQVMMGQPMLLDVPPPVKILGDIHGQYRDLLRLFKKGGFPPESSYLFLGDYVDRGKLGIEVICLLLAYKIRYPTGFWLLRGNHECASINRIYGFYDECKRKYNYQTWKLFIQCFDCFPIAAIVGSKIFCVHGGLSPEITHLSQILAIKRPISVPDAGIITDILWSDPDSNNDGWGENDRGVSYTFGKDVLQSFLNRHDLDLVCRAHQVVEDGYKFFPGRLLITIFSAPNYCSFENAAAMMAVDETLMCSFQVMQFEPAQSILQRFSKVAKS